MLLSMIVWNSYAISIDWTCCFPFSCVPLTYSISIGWPSWMSLMCSMSHIAEHSGVHTHYIHNGTCVIRHYQSRMHMMTASNIFIISDFVLMTREWMNIIHHVGIITNFNRCIVISIHHMDDNIDRIVHVIMASSSDIILYDIISSYMDGNNSRFMFTVNTYESGWPSMWS